MKPLDSEPGLILANGEAQELATVSVPEVLHDLVEGWAQVV
ncbi:hypothetical protein [Agrococcus sp. Ld7]